MARDSYLFTSESVSEGHPDKVCDQISDAVVDLIIGREPEARVACETAATTNTVVLMGEIKVSEENAPDPEAIAHAVRMSDAPAELVAARRATLEDVFLKITGALERQEWG